MKPHRHVSHLHRPLYRVVRAGWPDPLDASFSRRAADNRWNTPDFPALYCCCHVLVARAVALDVLKLAGVEIEDLQPPFRPRLVEVEWSGEVVDMFTAEGLAEAGFAAVYPEGASKVLTRDAAVAWHSAGLEGVVGRSPSLGRMGLTDWSGSCSEKGEIALFVENCRTPPVRLGHRDDHGWLSLGLGQQPSQQ